MAALGGDAVTCSAALLHSAYMLGEFGDGTRGTTEAKRTAVREAIGVDGERLVTAYHRIPWDLTTIHELASDVTAYTDETRRVAVLRIANAVDDHRDLGVRYRGCTSAELAADPEIPAMVELAVRLGHAELGEELRRAVDAEVRADVPAELMTRRDEHYTVRPLATRLRPMAWLRAEETPVARTVHRRLWRLRRGIIGR